MKAGVRQGCPLSGIIFATCVDILLRRICRILRPHELLRAYADDIALVLLDYQCSAGAISIIFKEFAEISALHLNIGKTVFIPLWPYQDETHIRRLLREDCPLWRNIHIDCKGKLLGIFVGPGAADCSWDKPLKQFIRRVEHWAALHMGLHWNILSFNTFIVTTLEFVAQHCVTSAAVNEAIERGLRTDQESDGQLLQQNIAYLIHRLGFNDASLITSLQPVLPSRCPQQRATHDTP